MAAVDLPANTTAESLVRALNEAGLLEGFPSRVVVRVGSECFIDPGAEALICVWGMRLRDHGTELKFFSAGGDDVLRYLSRMDLFSHLDLQYDERFERHTEAGRFIPLRLIDSSAACNSAVNAICDLVVHQFDNAREFVPALEWAVNEVLDNILLHAESSIPGVVCAQYYPQRARIKIGVCDMGRGIYESLRTGVDVWSHGHAITTALQRGVTRDPEIGQGNGLAGTLEIARRNGGQLHLWTGSAFYRSELGNDGQFEEIPEIPGTGLLLALDTTHPVDLRDTFIEATATNYLEIEAERVLNEGGLSIAEECPHTGAREPASALLRKIRALLPDMEGPLVLDFTDVESASSSFLDELLGRLAVSLLDEFRVRIQIRGANESIRRRANVVISQRLGG